MNPFPCLVTNTSQYKYVNEDSTQWPLGLKESKLFVTSTYGTVPNGQGKKEEEEEKRKRGTCVRGPKDKILVVAKRVQDRTL
jgi:hypothetical protein